MTDLLTLEVHDLHVNVLTGIYSQETHLPQPLHISVSADLEVAPVMKPANRPNCRSPPPTNIARLVAATRFSSTVGP